MQLTPFLPFLLLLLFFFFFSTPLSHANPKLEIDQWCTQVPHPHSCSTYLPGNHDVHCHRQTFYKLSLGAALGHVVRARRSLRHVQKRLFSSAANKTSSPDYQALFDCEKLYANTVLQINRTLLSQHRTHYDFQTWLSAGLTNLNMCRKLLSSANAAVDDAPKLDMISYLSRYNVSDLISNCLAINRPMLAAAGNATASFPTEVEERRLLRAVRADIVVAKVGSGKYTTVGAAVRAAASMARVSQRRLVIYVKAGVYKESVQIPSNIRDVTLIGDGRGKTIITNSNSVKKGYTMITSATVGVFGDGFIARDLTIRNTYGPGSQAVALLLASDRSVVYRSSIEGYQDTLCVFSQRQFFRECDISGTIDFIFGNAAVVIQKSNIILRKPLHGEGNVITAQGRSDPNQNTGIVIQSSNIISSAEFWPVHRSVKTFLGRPWMKYSRTVYLQNYISSIVDPEGWMPWSGNFALDTLYYAEFKNTGPGSRLSLRVKWPGYHVIVKPSLVSKFTVNNFIAGSMWIPTTSTPFTAGF